MFNFGVKKTRCTENKKKISRREIDYWMKKFLSAHPQNTLKNLINECQKYDVIKVKAV